MLAIMTLNTLLLILLLLEILSDFNSMVQNDLNSSFQNANGDIEKKDEKNVNLSNSISLPRKSKKKYFLEKS